jgi:hypothetical protein
MPGLYVLQLRHWLRAFELDQFHVMSSKAFAKDTKVEMQLLSAFLGGSSNNQVNRVNEKVLESKHRTKKKGGAKKANTAVSAAAAAALSPEATSEIKAFFEPFNQELWVLLGRQIDW